MLGQFSHALLVHIGKEDADHIISTHHLIPSSASIIALGGTTVPGATVAPGPRRHAPVFLVFHILGPLAHSGGGAHHGVLRHDGVLHSGAFLDAAPGMTMESFTTAPGATYTPANSTAKSISP